MKIFCTLIDAEVEQKINDECIAFAKRFAWEAEVDGGDESAGWLGNGLM